MFFASGHCKKQNLDIHSFGFTPDSQTKLVINCKKRDDTYIVSSTTFDQLILEEECVNLHK